ncbi:MAG: 30S ribosomal protein S21 [bacterium]|nr:30S ribosomal protein S21 [bacterium]
MFVRRKEGETTGSFLFRFSKKVQQSGILREVKKRKFHHRAKSRIKRKIAAIYRDDKKKEVERSKKMGLL